MRLRGTVQRLLSSHFLFVEPIRKIDSSTFLSRLLRINVMIINFVESYVAYIFPVH